MAAVNSPSPKHEDYGAELRKWLTALPAHIDYEHDDDGAVSRQEFLEAIARAVGPETGVLVYLKDSYRKESFLTLAYAAGISRNESSLPRRLALKVGESSELKFDAKPFLKFAALKSFGEPLLYALSEYRHPVPNKSDLSDKDLGLAVVFLPKKVQADSLMKTQLQMAWRLFSVEAARSRHQRLSLAISKMLEAINSSSDMDTLSLLLSKYCRSQAVYLYERRGSQYSIVGETFSDSRSKVREVVQNIEVQEISDLIADGQILRSHVFSEQLPRRLRRIVASSAWMLLPCATEAIDILSGETTRYPQFLVLLVDKENTEYLGEDYSYTDLAIGKSLVALLSNHVPYMGLAEKLNNILKELDKQLLGKFDLGWFANLASNYLPGLRSVGIFPEFPSIEHRIFCSS